MSLEPILISALVLLVISLLALLRQILGLKSKVAHLEKEVDIQDSRLTYQKTQVADSANYFYSAVVIIMEMMGEIDGALKSEDADLSEKILQIIFEKAKSLFRPKECVLFKINTQANESSCLFSFGYKEELLRSLAPALDTHNSFLGWSAATGRFLSIQEAEQDSILRHLITKDPLRCHYSQPLKVENKVKAVLCVGQLAQEIEYDEIVRLFSILSNIASVALSNATLTQELRSLSVRDSLTGLYNHSYFQKWLETSLGRLKEKDEVLSLVMVDLDYFKKINDTYGHQTGDIILKSISGLLDSLGKHDYICARYGGEEFALAFIGKDKTTTCSIMEDIRKKIAEQVFKIQDQRIRITISAGIAEVRSPKTKKLNKTDLIKAADQALYRAKDEGRNKIILD